MKESPHLKSQLSRSRILLPALLALLAILAPGWAGAQPPLPLDPLTEQEQQEAASLAQADPRVTSLLGPGPSVLAAVEFIALQKGEEGADPEHPLPIGRSAQVLFARYEGNLGVRALVDLVAHSVTVVESMSGDDVPMNLAELNAAWALARQNPAVRQVLGPEADFYQVLQDPDAPEPTHRVEGMRVVGAQSGDRCFGHRCLALLFQRLDEYLASTEVLVDLTTQTVTVTTDTGGETGASHQHLPASARRKP